MRCDYDRHPQFYCDYTHGHGANQKARKYPTRLAHGVEKENHDDWDCVEDLVAAGLVVWHGTGINPVFNLTEEGWRYTDILRREKAVRASYPVVEN